MQIENPETAAQTSVIDDQQKPVVPRDEAEIWMKDFRQRLNNYTPEQRQAFLREHSARAFRGQILTAELAGLMPADGEGEGASADADNGAAE